MQGIRMRRKTSHAARREILELARLKSRRQAIREFNSLVTELSLPLQQLRRRAPDVTLLGKVLRLLSKRYLASRCAKRSKVAAMRDESEHRTDGRGACKNISFQGPRIWS